MIYKVGAVIIKGRKLLVVKKRGLETFISPGGKPQGNEGPQATLVRELNEELGVRVLDALWLGCFEGEAVFDDAQIMMDTYVVQIAGNPKPHSEIEGLAWINSKYKDAGIKVAPLIEQFIIPKLVEMKLID